MHISWFLVRVSLLVVAATILLADLPTSANAQTTARPARVAILDFGTTETGSRAAQTLAKRIATDATFTVLDRDEGNVAARGSGYAGSLNLSLEEARNLGSVIGCDLFITGDARTVRRSSSTKPVYFESFAAIFIVSGRTGRLVRWDRLSFEASSPADAEKMLLDELNVRGKSYSDSLLKAFAEERNERAIAVTRDLPIIEETPEEGSLAAEGVRLPQPYRRLRPAYPDTAAVANVEATVDVVVDLDVEGEVDRVEVVRWAGFGLDESTVSTVQRMHFRPALRNGVPFPMRVLLRYNFQRPKKETASGQNQ